MDTICPLSTPIKKLVGAGPTGPPIKQSSKNKTLEVTQMLWKCLKKIMVYLPQLLCFMLLLQHWYTSKWMYYFLGTEVIQLKYQG